MLERNIFRNLVRVAAAVVSVAISCVCVAADATSATRPNILWITCEDHGPDMPFYGDPHSHMPNLSRLAENGILFTRAFATSPICAPSRSTIITGVYAATLGTHNMRTSVPLPDHVKPFPVYLREAGYYCTNNVKTDYNFPIPEGTWDESSRRAHWRKRPDPSQPFFSVFNFTVTHEGKFKMRDRPYEKLVQDVKPRHRVDPASLELPPYFPDTPLTRKDWARHYDTASQMDVEAGRILKQLEEDGLATNTIVFFFSDHGVGLPRNKRWMYDGGLHVPLVISWPGVLPAGARNDELVSLIDLAPTLLTILGLEVPDYMQGRVFLGDKKQPEPEYLFATRDRVDEVDEVTRSARDWRFKYIKNFHPERPYAQKSAYSDENPTMMELRRLHAAGELTGAAALFMQPTKPAEELYDTEKDPFEINNLAANPTYETKLREMRQALTDWQQMIQDKGLQPEPEDEKKRAAELRARRQGD